MKSFLKKLFFSGLIIICLSACSGLLPKRGAENRKLMSDQNPIVIDDGSYCDVVFWVENEKTGNKEKVVKDFYYFSLEDNQFEAEFISFASDELKLRLTNNDPMRGCSFVNVVLECKDGNQFTDRIPIYTREYYDTVPVMELEINEVENNQYCLSIQVLRLNGTPKVMKMIHIYSENDIACDPFTIENVEYTKYDYVFTPKGHGDDIINVDVETIDDLLTMSCVYVSF